MSNKAGENGLFISLLLYQWQKLIFENKYIVFFKTSILCADYILQKAKKYDEFSASLDLSVLSLGDEIGVKPELFIGRDVGDVGIKVFGHKIDSLPRGFSPSSLETFSRSSNKNSQWGL